MILLGQPAVARGAPVWILGQLAEIAVLVVAGWAVIGALWFAPTFLKALWEALTDTGAPLW